MSRVARCSLVLATILCRGSIDHGAGQPEAEDLLARVRKWFTDVDLWGEVEPPESNLLNVPLGALDFQDVVRATWYAEGLAVLAWAMKRVEFPRHDQKIDPYLVAEAVGFLRDDAREWIGAAELRPSAELKACRELLYAIHCRLRDFVRKRDRKDFTAWIEKGWLEKLGLDIRHLIVDGDLAINGEPISEVEEMRIQECEHITRERHRASIWLLESDSNYFLTRADT